MLGSHPCSKAAQPGVFLCVYILNTYKYIFKEQLHYGLVWCIAKGPGL